MDQAIISRIRKSLDGSWNGTKYNKLVVCETSNWKGRVALFQIVKIALLLPKVSYMQIQSPLQCNGFGTILPPHLFYVARASAILCAAQLPLSSMHSTAKPSGQNDLERIVTMECQ